MSAVPDTGSSALPAQFTPDRSEAETAASDARTRHMTLAILFITYTCAYLDRQILAILQEGVKRDLGLSDGQLGMLTGFGFALLYATLGIPVARLADWWVRKNVIAVSVAIWSVATALSGAVTSFFWLFVARVGVGAGEAGVSPASYSLLSDTFPPRQRAAALSIYNSASCLGVIIGSLFGAWLDKVVGWRAAFWIIGLPGLLVAAGIMLFLKEPPRAPRAKDGPSLGLVLRSMARNPKLRRIAPAIGLSAFISSAPAIWAVPFFMRTYQVPLTQVGPWIALTLGVGGLLGMFGMGFVADRLSRLDPRWYLWLPAMISLGMCPFFVTAYLASDPHVAILLMAVPFTLCGTFLAPALAVIYGQVGPDCRATASAVTLLIANLFGAGLGVWLVGIVSDLLTPAYGLFSIRYALLICVPTSCVLTAFFYLIAARVGSNPAAE